VSKITSVVTAFCVSAILLCITGAACAWLWALARKALEWAGAG